MRILIFMVAWLFSPIVFAQNFACPKMNDKVSTGDIRFEYKSWSWKHDQSFRLCHCVRNNSNRGLFVEWQGTSLRGFVKPGGYSYVMIQRPNEKFKTVKSDLWYGARPSKISVNTMVYDSTVVVPKLESSSKMSAPISVLGTVRVSSEGALRQMVAQNPDILQDVKMNFASSVDPSTGKTTISCSYAVEASHRGGLGWGRSSYLIAFSDPMLNLAMFGTKGPVAIVNGRPRNFVPSNTRKADVGRSGFSFVSVVSTKSSKPIVKSALLRFLSPEGIPVAQMPVRYHAVTQ